MPELSRLFQPKSIVVYGSSWAENVIHQCQKMEFSGEIWPVHPYRETIGGLTCFASISELPGVPDVAFRVNYQKLDGAARFVLHLALPNQAKLTCNNSLSLQQATCHCWDRIAMDLSIILMVHYYGQTNTAVGGAIAV